MDFTKPSLSINQQLELLTNRGMHISDREKAAHYLQYISYYRLRAYWLPFEVPATNGDDHMFADGTTFDQALDIYVFDRHLRLHLMDAIERVEVALRGCWAHHLAITYGPHGYLEPSLYRRPDYFRRARAVLLEEINRSRDTFIVHYTTKYTAPSEPPIWMTAEVISFGQLSKWIGNLKRRSDRNAIARPIGIDESVLVSLAHHLTYIRNICAHHGRLWNKQFTVTMTVPRKPKKLAESTDLTSSRKLYNTLTVICFLLEKIAPGTEWRERTIELLTSAQVIDLAAMGFPNDWRARPVWVKEQ